MGRRVEKTVLNRSGDAWLPESSILFVYNGYKLVEELDGLFDAKPPLRRYTWQPETLGPDVPLSVFDVATGRTDNYDDISPFCITLSKPTSSTITTDTTIRIWGNSDQELRVDGPVNVNMKSGCNSLNRSIMRQSIIIMIIIFFSN